MRRPLLAFAIVALAVIALDQVSKAVVRASLDLGQSVPVVRDVFYLTHVLNDGAAFGLMPGYRPLFIAVTMAVLVAIGVFWWASRPDSWLVVISLGLICGGAVGNLVDRLSAGRVTDFFDAAFISFPVFNVADIAVVTGTGLLVFWLLFSPEHRQAEAAEVADVPVPGDGDAATTDPEVRE